MSSIIENAFRAFASHDPDRISAVLTEDAEWLSPPGNPSAAALGGTHHIVGKEAIVRFFAQDFPRLYARDVAVTLHGVHTDGERVVVESTMTATLANGKPLRQRLLLRLRTPGRADPPGSRVRGHSPRAPHGPGRCSTVGGSGPAVSRPARRTDLGRRTFLSAPSAQLSGHTPSTTTPLSDHRRPDISPPAGRRRGIPTGHQHPV
ncbi:nuclear transport factor 2 family protein [Streptomyces rimosus]|uniref:nuclear transport factor 2 family protein n=1 Tax=Streptomyces rimosus TaxID=1927 RepID=UPI0018FE9A52